MEAPSKELATVARAGTAHTGTEACGQRTPILRPFSKLRDRVLAIEGETGTLFGALCAAFVR
jgi:hypothetical protein